MAGSHSDLSVGEAFPGCWGDAFPEHQGAKQREGKHTGLCVRQGGIQRNPGSCSALLLVDSRHPAQSQGQSINTG